VLLPDHFPDPVVRQRFLQEADLVAKLDHPHILKVLEYGANADQAWMVLPYVDGSTLRALLAGGTLPWRDVARMGRHVASALATIHAASIVHRDLKPENVLVDRAGNALLVDFGISKPRRSGLNTGAGMILGTPGYIAPEMVSDRAISTASDMFSLGVLLWEMLTGFRPHQRKDPGDPASGRTRLDELVASREQTVGRLTEHAPDVPRSFEGLVTRLLEKSAENRPTAEVVVEELSWIENSPMGVDTPRDFSMTVRTSRPPKEPGQRETTPPPIPSGNARITASSAKLRRPNRKREMMIRAAAVALGLVALVGVLFALR
jgi:serine/threonine protein kinase